MTDRELMQQALKALKDVVDAEEARSWGVFGVDKQTPLKRARSAITALRERLAQPEQEPVAWMWRCKPYCDWPEWSVSLKRPADSGRDGHKRTEGYEDVPLYTSPPASKPWVALTDEEKNQVAWSCGSMSADWLEFADAIEAKLKEKNG